VVIQFVQQADVVDIDGSGFIAGAEPQLLFS
jgi:hypothetical protein